MECTWGCLVEVATAESGGQYYLHEVAWAEQVVCLAEQAECGEERRKSVQNVPALVSILAVFAVFAEGEPEPLLAMAVALRLQFFQPVVVRAQVVSLALVLCLAAMEAEQRTLVLQRWVRGAALTSYQLCQLAKAGELSLTQLLCSAKVAALFRLTRFLLGWIYFGGQKITKRCVPLNLGRIARTTFF